MEKNTLENYPENMDLSLERMDKIRIAIENLLNDAECPTLETLYQERNGKNFRKQQIFDSLTYHPNCPENKNEFRGLYVFGEKTEENSIKPVYVGISRTVYRRLRQHGWGNYQNECTLAYLIAKKQFNLTFNKNDKKKNKDNLQIGKNEVKKFKVALYHFENDYELYLMEVILAGMWKTKWNSFRTH
jgi:hypothetical protein